MQNKTKNEICVIFYMNNRFFGLRKKNMKEIDQIIHKIFLGSGTNMIFIEMFFS